MANREFILRGYVRNALSAVAVGSVSIALGSSCQQLAAEEIVSNEYLLVEIEDDCPSVDEAKVLLVGNTKCTDPVLEITDVNQFIERKEHYEGDYTWDTGEQSLSTTHEQCIYEVTMKTRPDESCIIGRPLMDAGKQVTGRLVKAKGGQWRDSRSSPDIAGLNKDTRAVLATLWGRTALGEQASVASFARFTMQLMAHGAPPDLLRRSNQAGIDEIGHATASFAITSTYIGEPVEPSALPVAPAPNPSLAEFVSATIIEGCIGETLAVLQAIEQFKVATDKTVRKVLAQIIHDEQNHSELAYDTVEWALSVGGPEVLRAAEEAFARAPSLVPNGIPTPVLSEAHIRELAAHGFVCSEDIREALQRGINEVISPAAERLLSPYKAS